MVIERLPGAFTVCKIADPQVIHWTDAFVFVGKTDNELSLVCETAAVPQDTLSREDGWRGLRVAGALDFSLIGILSSITTLLAQNAVSVFAVSTYDTDYIFVKQERLDAAVAALEKAYTIT